MQDFTAVRGDTLEYDFEFVDSEGNPIDISGAEITMTVRDKTTFNIVFSKTQTVHVDTMQGKSLLRIESSDWPATSPACCLYDMQIEEEDGTVTTFSRGEFTVINDITK